ncbi:ORF01L [Marbled eel polyomavirus]|uniref:ORF01L n=1 Tax=Marbled eel polyomavirus TaxID=1662286 RepID=UPI0007C194C9|nr:ORF01L [Marbled eel polyomavirus]ANC70189.1 ORF01L [Marbled eel polyomavirus]
MTGALQAYETTFDPNYCGLTDSISLQDEPPPREHRDDAPGENARQALLHILPHVDSSLSQVDFVSAVKDAIANDHKKARKLRRLLEQYETDVAGDDSESESSASDGSSPRRSLFDDLFEREEEDSYESPPTSPLPIVDLTGSSDEEGPTSRKRVNSDGEGEEIPRRRARRLSEDQEGEGPSAVSDVEEEAWPEEDEEPMSSYQPHSPTPPSSPEPMSSGFARPWPTSPSLPPSPQPIRSGSGRPPSDYFSASQASQPATGTSQPTPEKGLPPEIPPLFQDFLSKALNTHSTVHCFLLFYSRCKYDVVQAALGSVGDVEGTVTGCYEEYDNNMFVQLVRFQSPHRQTRLRNVLKPLFTSVNHCLVRVVLAKKWAHSVHKLRLRCQPVHDRCNQPSIAESHEFNDSEGDANENAFSIKLLNEFAMVFGYTDCLAVIGNYDKLAIKPDDCSRCVEPSQEDVRNPDSHFNLHQTHFNNAQLFQLQKDKKRLAGNATVTVMAHQRLKYQTITEQDFYMERLSEILDDLLKDSTNLFELYIAQLAVQQILGWQVDVFLRAVHKALIIGEPKTRYVIFKGPYNSGKTTLAASVANWLQGCTLNVNIPAEKLPFELGRAIGRRMVIFEDVKGKPESEEDDLTTGFGFTRLDDHRDYLDGHVKVGLEKKHQDKVEQVFPAGIITMNNYVIPSAIRARVSRIFTFTSNPRVRGLMNKYSISARLLTDPRVLVFSAVASSLTTLDSATGLSMFQPPFWPAKDAPRFSDRLDLLAARMFALDTDAVDQHLESMDSAFGPPEPIVKLLTEDKPASRRLDRVRQALIDGRNNNS